MKIRQNILPAPLLLGFLLGAFLLVANVAWPAMVRGRLDRTIAPGRQVPAPGIAVTIVSPQSGRTAPAYSGPDGMYYLHVPPGNYTLEVWISRDPRVQPIRLQIQVVEPYKDVQVTIVP